MNEPISEQWISLSSNDKYTFLENLKLNNRLYTLFACACVRQIWNKLTDQRNKDAIIITELYIDGKATHEELITAKNVAYAAYNAANAAAWDATYAVAAVANAAYWTSTAATAVVYAANAANAVDDAVNAVYAANAANAVVAAAYSAANYSTVAVDNRKEMIIIQGKLLESIIQPNLQYNKDWRSSTVKLLTQQIYEQQDWNLLPILADALQDNNCNNDELLLELRNGNLWCKGNRLFDEILEKRKLLKSIS